MGSLFSSQIERERERLIEDGEDGGDVVLLELGIVWQKRATRGQNGISAGGLRAIVQVVLHKEVEDHDGMTLGFDGGGGRT